MKSSALAFQLPDPDLMPVALCTATLAPVSAPKPIGSSWLRPYPGVTVPGWLALFLLASVLVGGEGLAQSESGSRSDDKKRVQEKSFIRYRSISYLKHDEQTDLLCDLFVPEGKGPFPAILMIHGGAWRSGTKLQMKWHAESAARNGFVAMSINYRHAPRYKWPAQIEDCREAVRWMLKNADRYRIDRKKIAVWGYSAGGHLATFLATKPEPGHPRLPIRCVVCGGGPVDLTLFSKDFPFLVYFLGATRREDPKKYEQASPITHLTRDDPPLFFYHGENDSLVPLEGVKKMNAQAKKLGIRSELVVVSGKEHLLTFFDQASYDRGLDFIKRELTR